MNTLDLIILIPIVLGFIQGLFKGLIKELTSFAVIVIGIYGAKLLATPFEKLLLNIAFLSPQITKPLAFLLGFIIIAIGLFILAHLLDKTLSFIQLSGVNKFLGGIVGSLKYLLILSILLNVFDTVDNHFHLINKTTKEQSLTYSKVLKVAPVLWEEVKDKKSTDQKNTIQKNKIESNKNK